jgi:ATP phosphoribosyltransferase
MKNIILAIPKGRILKELRPFLEKKNIILEDDFFNENSRKLIFKTNIDNLEVVKVRSFDVANIVKFGGADIGICGSDVIQEFLSPEFYSILDLKIGKCRLSLAHPSNIDGNFANHQKITVATKYLNISQKYFDNLGYQADFIKLNGSIEIATKLKLCDFIIDLVSSGATLIENQMVESNKIMDISSFLIANRNSLKIKNSEIYKIIKIFNLEK